MSWYNARWGVPLLTLALWSGLAPALAFAAPAATESRIFLVALGDNGASGERIGCGDSLVPVTTEIPNPTTIEERIGLTLTQLFSLRGTAYGKSGLSTALAASRLTVDRVTIQNGVAAVYRSGTLTLGGVCDDARAVAQIAATASRFQGVSRAEIIFNGGPLTNAVGKHPFPQVPYTVAPPCYPYWDEQGGLPIFGLPLSQQIVEEGYRTQYFERQRLEAHPENAAPYRVLLGLVGSETAARRNLLTTAPFAPKENGGAGWAASTSPRRATPSATISAPTGTATASTSASRA